MKKYFLLFSFLFSLSISSLQADVTQNQMIDAVVESINNIKFDPKINVDEKILRSAKAIAIIPAMTKAGVIFTGQKGNGIFSIKDTNGNWSSPVFIKYTGFGAGWQIGYSATDLVLVFLTRRSYLGIFDGKCTIDFTGDVSIIKGYKGAGVTDVPEISAEIFAFGKSRGLFAGISIENSTIIIDDVATNDYYKRMYRYEDILNNSPKESKYTKKLKYILKKYF